MVTLRTSLLGRQRPSWHPPSLCWNVYQIVTISIILNIHAARWGLGGEVMVWGYLDGKVQSCMIVSKPVHPDSGDWLQLIAVKAL